jgi:hypothetical protein
MAMEIGRGDVRSAHECLSIGDQMRARAGRRPVEMQPIAQSAPAQASTTIAKARAQTPACEAQITARPIEQGRMVAIGIAGTVGNGCPAVLMNVISDAAAKYPTAHPIVLLDSPGGSVGAALSFARMFSEGNVPVGIPPHAECASACFLILAAAQQKFVSPTARIGVHSVTEATTGVETVAAKAVTTELARACAGFGVPPAIIGRMVTTPPGEVAWLSEAELRSMGVSVTPREDDY